MENWKEKIQETVATYISKRDEIENLLEECLKELEQTPFNYGTSWKQDLISPMAWSVKVSIPKIGEVDIVFSFEDIANSQGEYNSIGVWEKQFPTDIKSAIEGILVQKIIKELS
ncbi:hypothetical protein [Paenibacillus amylolyticus]|uniref:hypothetical protein n=1 Tax=Paenibacillus amylolyticus TaxID=1451 RepID=UPI003D963A06